MVCQKCEKKTSTLATTDPFRTASSTAGSSSRAPSLGVNKLLEARKRAAPYAKPGQSKSINTYKKCMECKNNATRCQKCAYKKGVCSICGVLVLKDVKRYKQSAK